MHGQRAVISQQDLLPHAISYNSYTAVHGMDQCFWRTLQQTAYKSRMFNVH